MTSPRPAKILCYIVAYNASSHIEGVLSAIPAECWSNDRYQFEVLISDDFSKDDTTQVAQRYADSSPHPITVTRTPKNLGYGGNQKLGYQYAIDHGFDAVILLHGDGQYAPGLMPQLLEPILQDNADIVIGSRMMQKKMALRGGMPMYKFVANILLTALQNRIIGYHLSEFHSGYRIYTTRALRAIPFQSNADYFDFDTDILIQCIDTKQRIVEISIPTFYGDEICHVNGAKYVFKILVSSVISRLQKHGLVNIPKFRYEAPVPPRE